MFWIWIKFIISLVIITVLHEFGHYLIAKLFGVEVEVFSIGFGKPLYYKKIFNTKFQIAPIFLGGYCKLKGEFYGDGKSHLASQRYLKKLCIFLGGCLVNILTAFLIFYYFGHPFYYFCLSLKLWYASFTQVNLIPLIALVPNSNIFWFGILSAVLGIVNLIPIPPLDGSYVFLVFLEKFVNKRKAGLIIEKIFYWSLRILISSIILIYIFSLLGCSAVNYNLRKEVKRFRDLNKELQIINRK